MYLTMSVESDRNKLLSQSRVSTASQLVLSFGVSKSTKFLFGIGKKVTIHKILMAKCHRKRLSG